MYINILCLKWTCSVDAARWGLDRLLWHLVMYKISASRGPSNGLLISKNCGSLSPGKFHFELGCLCNWFHYEPPWQPGWLWNLHSCQGPCAIISFQPPLHFGLAGTYKVWCKKVTFSHMPTQECYDIWLEREVLYNNIPLWLPRSRNRSKIVYQIIWQCSLVPRLPHVSMKRGSLVFWVTCIVT